MEGSVGALIFVSVGINENVVGNIILACTDENLFLLHESSLYIHPSKIELNVKSSTELMFWKYEPLSLKSTPNDTHV